MILRRILTNWPIKLAALVLALLIWFFVNQNDTNVSRGTFTVPVTVEGLGENEVPSGVPETADITLSGPLLRLERLRPEALDATLDLTGESGDYQVEITPTVPQGLELISVDPAEAIGSIEAIQTKTVPIEVALSGAGAPDLLTPSFAPQSATVRGRTSVLARIERAVGTVPAAAGEYTVQLYNVDAAGKPVNDSMLSLEPLELNVTLTEVPVLYTKAVPLDVAPPDTTPLVLSSFALLQETLTVTGPRAALDGLEVVAGAVELDTSGLEPGEYTLQVRPQLPEGVTARERASAQLVLSAPPDSPGPDGERDDVPGTPIR